MSQPNKIKHTDEYDYNPGREEDIWRYYTTTHGPKGGDYFIRVFSQREDILFDVNGASGRVEVSSRSGKFYVLDLRNGRLNFEDLSIHIELLAYVYKVIAFMQKTFFFRSVYDYPGLKKLEHPLDRQP